MNAGQPSLSLPAPAKLNLFLHIVGRRADGYHELETLFQFLDWGDTLSFSASDELYLSGACGEVAQEDNLVLRAARLLQEKTRHKGGAAIQLTKRIPMGAGLGGGSSDAATTLLGLNRLWRTGLRIEQLAELGLTLGADVPVFVRGRAAFAQGVGEILTPACPAEDCYLVIWPACSVPTAAIFGAPELPRATPRLLQTAGIDPWLLGNDCQDTACRRFPEVEKALGWLLNFAPARMTGTGSCVFARFTSAAEARQCRDKVPAPWLGFVAQGVNLSPAHVALSR